MFVNWDRQLRLLKTTYQLQDESMRVLIAMRLMWKALNWQHWKSELIGMSVEQFLGEMRGMFLSHQGQTLLCRQFEPRIWRRSETFQEYVHQKVIIGNRVPVAEDEVLDYLIE